VQLDGSGTTVGGTTSGTGNTIAHNTDDGVIVMAGTGNRILRNSIFDNGSPATADDLGIDLSPGGVTANDATDTDTDANNRQNFPELAGAQANSVDTTVQGTLNSNASRTYRVEIFSSPACDTAGNGEGKTFLGATDVTTDSAGTATIAATVNPSTVGNQVTATATDATTGDTSEFSTCQAIASKAEPPATSPPPGPNPGPGPGGGGGGGATPDTTAPLLALGGDGKQDSKKKVEVEVSCDEVCTVSANGTIKVPKLKNGKVKSKEKFDLKRAGDLQLGAGESANLKLKFKNKTVDLVKKALKKKTSKAKVTVTALDTAGNETAEKLTIKVKK
jgi:hypothetical protein